MNESLKDFNKEDLIAIVEMIKQRNEQLVRDITAERKVYETHVTAIEKQLAELQPRADHQKAADQSRIKELEKKLKSKQYEIRALKIRHKKEMTATISLPQGLVVTCEPHLL